MMDLVCFDVTDEDEDLIHQIANRAVSIWVNAPSQKHVAMDVTAVHANGCPLRLEALLDAKNHNFMHDIEGIYRHLNRQTGQLEGFFLPRFAQPESDQ